MKNQFYMMRALKAALAVTLAACICLLSACTGGDSQSTPSAPLSELMAQLYDGITDAPATGDVQLNAENFKYYAFVDYKDGYEGLASDALISAIAHSVVLVRTDDGAAELASQIESAADPAKWICVTAEKTIVRRKGNLILLVMSTEELADAIAANFDKLA